MTQDWMNFEEFLWDSFCDGQTKRELRLSQDELSYLQGRYPLASSSARSQKQSDGKTWYLITLPQIS
jgi:hypothetical protein